MLNVEDSAVIYDLGSGSGTFLTSLFDHSKAENKAVKLIGSEINSEEAFISKVVLSLRNADYEIYTGDALKAVKDLHYARSYVFPPFSARYPEGIADYFNDQFGNLFNTRSNSEWFFVFRALSNLERGGRIIALLREGALFRNTDRSIRKYLIDNNILQGIVSLPARSLEGMGVKTDLVIIGESDGGFKAVNAAKMVKNTGDKRYIQIDENAILAAYYSDDVEKHSYEEAKERDYNLNIGAYADINVKEMIDCPTDISDVSSIIVGSQYPISHFKSVFSGEPTKYQLLTSGNIENGIIDYNSLQFIENDEKLDKFQLQEGDIVITTKSTKVKTAVAYDLPDRHVIVTGGMLIVRADQKRINPTYLKMFLDSEVGQSILRTIQKGTVITTISVPAFKHIKVACPSLERQNRLADKYNSLLSMYAALKQQMNDMQLQINTLYDDSLKGDEE